MLIGKNVALRPTTAEDLKFLMDWVNDPAYFGPDDNHWTVTLEGMQRAHEDALRRERHHYLITDRASGEPLGQIGYGSPFTNRYFQGEELSYTVHPSQRGRGVATQAACLLINHLFDATPVNRIQATVVVGNQASCRVLEHAGMRPEGILRGLLFLHGRYVDLHIYSILRAEWCDEQTYRSQRREF